VTITAGSGVATREDQFLPLTGNFCRPILLAWIVDAPSAVSGKCAPAGSSPTAMRQAAAATARTLLITRLVILVSSHYVGTCRCSPSLLLSTRGTI